MIKDIKRLNNTLTISVLKRKHCVNENDIYLNGSLIMKLPFETEKFDIEYIEVELDIKDINIEEITLHNDEFCNIEIQCKISSLINIFGLKIKRNLFNNTVTCNSLLPFNGKLSYDNIFKLKLLLHKSSGIEDEFVYTDSMGLYKIIDIILQSNLKRNHYLISKSMMEFLLSGTSTNFIMSEDKTFEVDKINHSCIERIKKYEKNKYKKHK